MNKKLITAGLFLGIFFSEEFSAQSHISTQPHQSAITALTPVHSDTGEKGFFSSGQDGFLIKWQEDNQGEHYQVSELAIKLTACSPDGKNIAVYETDGGQINRVSVWNWETLTRKYFRHFSDSVTSLSYSASGSYLIIGTATVDGAVFLNATTGDPVDKIHVPTGIVSYVETSQSEKTAIMYSPVGNLSYYNLQTGTLKNRFPAEQGISQVTVFNNGLFLSGVKNRTIYVLYTLTGKTVVSFPAVNPIILNSPDDENLYYLEYYGKGGYSLKMLKNVDNKTVSEPNIIKNYKGPSGSGAICCGTKVGPAVILGSRTGELYRTDSEPDSNTLTLNPLTENMYDKIYDMSPVGEDFYFLTKNAVFKSSYDSGSVSKVAQNQGQTQIITYGDKIILWSKGTRHPVQILDFTAQKATDLFIPKAPIQTVRLFGTTLIDIESNTAINSFDLTSGVSAELYSGTALQDAVIQPDGKLYIAKSSATSPFSAFICVDMTTKETVPLQLDGNVSFALSSHGPLIYGIVVKSDDTEKNTSVFSFDTGTKKTVYFLRLPGENSDAFTGLHDQSLYTNIGKDSVCSYDLNTGSSFQYNRSASLPVKVLQNTQHTVVLNRDGSISWYDNAMPEVLSDWYLTQDGQWYEF